MLVGVETDYLGETTMRQISDCLPAWLIDEIAARGHDGAHNLNEGGAPPQGGESEAPLPSLEVAPANRVKGRGAMPRQVQNRGWARSREGDDARSVNAPALVLIWSNRGEPTHAAHEGVFPARRVGSPVLVWDRDHATLANSP
jgi:hypothetical protein